MTSINAAQAAAFYREVVERGRVWTTIRDAHGIPAPKNGDGLRAMPFWSKRSRAERVIASVDTYQGFAPLEVSLEEWRQPWLPGLSRNGLLVGLNWSGSRATGVDSHRTMSKRPCAGLSRP